MPIAEAASLAGLGWVASPVVKDLVTRSISYLGSDIAKGLEDLETTLLPQFQLTIQAAQHSPHKAQLTRWLARLKNAYYEAEGILHGLEYERLKRKAKGEDKKLLVRLSSKPIIKPLAKFAGQVVKKASLLSPQKRKLLQRLNELKKVAAEAKTFRDLLTIHNTESKDAIIAGNNPFVTSSLLGIADKVFGRDRDRDEIITFLLDEQGGSSSTKSYSVVAVTGMGGAGKTTLAQYVYNDSRVKKHFPLRMWLCLSRNLDITKYTKQMIECASKKKCPNLDNFDSLQNKLLETLPESDNILVVLDDVWYDNNDRPVGEKQWENLLKPFDSRGGTCKIIVTSRSSWLFPNALKPGKLIELRDLTSDDFISLLRYHAIDGLQISNPQLKNDLSDIVDHIAKKMSKLPLTAKVVGNQLREWPNIRFWQATLENANLSDTIEILLWSFHRFDVQLQRCFLFCSVFPKDTEFDLLTLVPYWVALDFIQPSDDNENVEDIGLKYFQKMVANSIFHLVDKLYIMHDLFHDLAEKLSTEDCFRVTNDKGEIPSTVQHVYLTVNNENLKENLSSIGNLSNLRTLFLGNPFIDDISEIIPKISTNFRNLRILDVASRGYKTLPRVIGDFRNLRMLNFGKSSIEELPDSVLQLYHLQFLYLPSSVRSLPTKLSNFIKLRHIEMYNSDGSPIDTLPPVPYLGKLTSLQGLDEFHVRKEEGYELEQLGRLKEIGGSLRIVNLENVRYKNEAVEARLFDKLKLKNLELVWAESSENDLEIEIIEALRPPANLELLTIDGYMGLTYPTWLQEGSFIENIKGVTFYNCNALTILPQNFHQFRHCSKLVLQNLGALRELSTFPKNLTRLSIIKLPCLIFVCENELQVNEMETEFLICGVESFKDILDHELKSFEQTGSIENCAEQLQIVESAARGNASQLSINVNGAWWCCHQQRMNFIFRCSPQTNKLKLPSMLRILDLGYCCVSDGALSDCLRGMTTLEELYLSGIMTITTLPPAQVLESLQSLRVIEIKHCWYLRSLGGLHALPHLESFLVEACRMKSDNTFGSMLESFLHFERFLVEDYSMENGYTSRSMLETFLPTSTRLPPTLQSFIIISCAVPQAILNGDLPCLQNVVISNCLVPWSLSFCQLTLLKSLALVNCPDIFFMQGLESRPFIDTLYLLLLPNLDVESVLEFCQGCRQLVISSSVMLNKLLTSQDFIPPQWLCIKYCQEEAISFEKSNHLQSIKRLVFLECKTSGLPETLSDFSTLEFIDFKDCPDISRLPELPGSVQHIRIRGCPALRERCQSNGLDWHKIQCIQHREIE